MAKDDFDSITNALSTGAIVAIVIGSLIGLAVFIAVIVIIICVIKHCNRPRYPATQGIILQPQPYPYPHSLINQYPPNITSVSNYPPPYQSVPPPYTASAPESNKSPYT